MVVATACTPINYVLMRDGTTKTHGGGGAALLELELRDQSMVYVLLLLGHGSAIHAQVQTEHMERSEV